MTSVTSEEGISYTMDQEDYKFLTAKDGSGLGIGEEFVKKIIIGTLGCCSFADLMFYCTNLDIKGLMELLGMEEYFQNKAGCNAMLILGLTQKMVSEKNPSMIFFRSWTVLTNLTRSCRLPGCSIRFSVKISQSCLRI